MAAEPLELEHLVRLRQDIRDAITNARRIGAEPADVITCLARVVGETIAKAGIAAPPPEILTSIALSVRSGCLEEHQRHSEASQPSIYTARGRR